jgi:hypothetical protein
MSGVTIGKYLPNGFPGTYAEQGDHLIKTFPNTGDATMYFGSPVFAYDGGCAAISSTGLVPTATNFKGIAIAHVQSANTYTAQNMGTYDEYTAVPVAERAGISVQVNGTSSNAPARESAVYVRVANGTTAKPIGGFEAAADSTTYTATVTTQTSGSTSIVISSVANLAVGMTASGTGIPSGAHITAISSSTLTITISAAATSTASSGTLTFSGNTLALTNCVFGSTDDDNGVALLIIKSRNNA